MVNHQLALRVAGRWVRSKQQLDYKKYVDDEMLRDKLIKLANDHPEMRQHIVSLLQKHAALTKQDVELNLPAGPQTVPMVVSGNWGIHKSLVGRGWAVTHIPSSLLVLTAKTQKAALGALEGISRDRGLLNARSQSDIMKYKDFLLKLRQQLSGKKPVIDIERILLDEGLNSQGSRYGKAGEFWGIQGSSRMIAVGRRDVLLNVFFVGIDSVVAMRRPDTRWLMKNAEYKTKMKEEVLRKWARWAKKGISTAELRKIARDEFERKGGFVSIDGGQYSK